MESDDAFRLIPHDLAGRLLWALFIFAVLALTAPRANPFS